MTAYPVWKALMVALLILVPGSLVLLALVLAHRKFVQRRLTPIPRALNGRDALGPSSELDRR
ncbi:MAG TPA: hypothetical protein VHM70_00315 [Polyangiaceae bacterium]|jgi:hypothetical protein|nr:hypothetical protein [Polyangiaceae bacterium]